MSGWEEQGQRRAEEAPPEFLNRIDDIVVFHQLTQEQIITMVDLYDHLGWRAGHKDMAIELPGRQGLRTAAGGTRCWERGRCAARSSEIEDQLSEKILFGEEPGQIVIVDAEA